MPFTFQLLHFFCTFTKSTKFQRASLLEKFNYTVDSLMPADFNGDRIQDLLVYCKKDKLVFIFWGRGNIDTKQLNTIEPHNFTKIEDVYIEPLLFDFDGDRVVDIFTSIGGDNFRHVMTCKNITACTRRQLSNDTSTYPTITEFHSNSFIDLNGDMVADLIVSTEKYYETWIWMGPELWELGPKRNYPNGVSAASVGQSVFVDLDSTANLRHIVQACDARDLCNQIYMWKEPGGKWETLYKTAVGEVFWRNKDYQQGANAMMSLKSADLDQDGYPDFVTIVEKTADKTRGALVILNKRCSTPVGGVCGEGRQLLETSAGDFTKFNQIVNLGFFDIHEDGKVDVLISNGDIKSKANWTVHALQNTFSLDACFIKVITVSGLCSKDTCNSVGDGFIEYGYNQPGPIVKYRITDSNADPRNSVAAQMYQTAHGALQLPYILFGIGLSPNFVDKLEVRMPGLNETGEWTQIIPNSQMVVIPNPIDRPSLWQTKLFITPSRKMLATGGALIGVVVVNLIIIMVLHYMEKRVDRIEKQQQAHRFNFDAM